MTIITPQLGISPTSTLGGEVYDREILKQFVKLGHDVRILLPKGKSTPPEIPEMMIDRTPISHFVPPYTFNLFSLPWALRNFKKKKILRIHSPEYLFPTAYMVKELRPEVPIVAHYHLDQTGRLWTMTNRKLLNMIDAVIADSEYLKERLVNRVGVDEKLIRVIHCGVDVEAIKPPAPRASRLAPRAKTLLFLGRFVERKRPDFAIKVFARLHQKHPETRLIMIGEGPMEEQLKIQSEKLKIKKAVRFTGALFGKKKLKKFHQADLFIFPSEKEGFVLVVLEAMAAGLPLLVPHTLGFPEAIQDGKNGLLAGPNEIDDWMLKAERILFNQGLNRSMRKQSREMAVRRFSWKRCAQENLKLYESF